MPINLVGQTFGKLSVTEKLPAQYYLCQCSCGSVTKVHYSNLRYRHVKSCGCSREEHLQQTLENNLRAKAMREQRWLTYA